MPQRWCRSTSLHDPEGLGVASALRENRSPGASGRPCNPYGVVGMEFVQCFRMMMKMIINPYLTRRRLPCTGAGTPQGPRAQNSCAAESHLMMRLSSQLIIQCGCRRSNRPTPMTPSGLDRNKDPHVTGISEAPLMSNARSRQALCWIGRWHRPVEAGSYLPDRGSGPC